MTPGRDQFTLYRDELEELDDRLRDRIWELETQLREGAELANSVLSRIWERHPDWKDGVFTMLHDWLDRYMPDEPAN